MRKYFIFHWLLFSLVLFSCSPDIQVDWHEPGAQWEGIVEGGIIIPGSPVTVRCCKPGNNCAKRGVQSGPIGVQIRGYIERDDLSSYFRNEDWAAEIPELVGRNDIVELIKTTNPKAVLLNNTDGFQDLVIYKERDADETLPSNILFVVQNKLAPDPCDQ